MKKIYELQLGQYQFSHDVNLWLKFLSYLYTHDAKEANLQFQKALVILRNDGPKSGFNSKRANTSVEDLERLITEFGKLK